ncbi:pyruvate dehydrogenase (acetyl-transferring) E1 component subunit alpha [Kutzneria viridogrisea]|uniref:Pyruvate dehydrogenase E1 component alpha subunit n=1 Tax=Kutzneria viridogrisea TaxID=47990 RepID=A0ABR6BN58_9PSEU|nr:pyruvate dehydrogenase E1 component alpha subunit [Kutzneria viridogrisea]
MSDSVVQDLLPSPTPVRLLAEDGTTVEGCPTGYERPTVPQLLAAHRKMVIGRRFDAQATALTKQGRLAVYPSSHGQEACQIAAAEVLGPGDWLFPTYRDSVALVARGVDPVEVLTLLRGDWHCGYDPKAVRVAPQCTPLATQVLHATGLASAMRRKGENTAVLALIGDGATSEGDFHEALNFAAVFNAPVVFLVQNNGYAISVPLSKQSAAPSLAYKGIGYGVRSEQVDGNDTAAMLAVLGTAMDRARSGGGPFLVEAHTYRLEAHTNADDATRYRDQEEVRGWLAADPLPRLEKHLRDVGALTDEDVRAAQEEGERLAADLRQRMNADPHLDPMSLFDHVYAVPTPQLAEQRDLLATELKAQEG